MRGATPCSLGSMMDSGAGRSATSRGMQEAERLQGSMAYPQRGLARGVHHRRRGEARSHHQHRSPPRGIRTITATAEPEGRNKTSPRPFDCAQGRLQFCVGCISESRAGFSRRHAIPWPPSCPQTRRTRIGTRPHAKSLFAFTHRVTKELQAADGGSVIEIR